MTFESESQETLQKTFDELYEITTGNTKNFYAAGKRPIIFNSITYNPQTIKRGKLSDNEKLRAKRVAITTGIDEQMSRYISTTPAEKMTIKVTRVYRNLLQDAVVLFFGEVIDITIFDQVATVNCDSLPQVFLNQIPKFVHQTHCNHRLFNDGCKLLSADFRVDAVVTVSGSTLDSASFGAFLSGHFTGGHVISADGDMRLITNHVGNIITLQVPFDTRVANDDTVSAFPGCDKSANTCINKFDNLVNFLGFPYIPSSNPTIWGFSS